MTCGGATLSDPLTTLAPMDGGFDRHSPVPDRITHKETKPMELMQASNQWASRPSDERYTSLLDMQDHFDHQRANSRALTVPSRMLTCEPLEGTNHRGMVVSGANGVPY